MKYGVVRILARVLRGFLPGALSALAPTFGPYRKSRITSKRARSLCCGPPALCPNKPTRSKPRSTVGSPEKITKRYASDRPQAYARTQKCGMRAALRLFATGWYEQPAEQVPCVFAAKHGQVK
jgi:hypothetical protein